MRVKRPHAALELDRGRARVEATVPGADLLRVGRRGVVLLDELDRAGGAAVERLDQQPGAEVLEALGEPAEVVVADRHRLARRDRAGVEAGGDPHDRHPGLGIAGHDRALDRRGSPPARQQRRVHVEQLELAQQRLAQQLAEGADDAELGLGGADPLERLIALGRLGAQDVDPELLGGRGGRRRRGAAPAAAAAVGRRDDERRAVRGGGEPAQDGGGEVRGAEVDDPHPSSGSGSVSGL